MKRLTVVGLALAGILTALPAFAQVRLNAAGATFPYPIYSKWFGEYQRESGVEINYQSQGSGAGIKQLQSGTVDFGASDMPLKDAQYSGFKVKPLHFPTVLGAVVPTYNLPGNPELKFSGETLAKIFMGDIKKWNDAAIKSENGGVSLPDADIVVVHRSDGSGTTFVFTDFLSKVSEWKSKVGNPDTSVNWPVGLGGKGNEGVAGLVHNTPNSIGYVELIYALQNKMGFGAVKNASGKYLKANLEGISAAAAADVKNIPADFRVSITNAPGATSYPISTFTYLLIPSKFEDASKRDAVKKFLNWMLTKGQADCQSLDYGKLPASIITREQAQINQIK